MLRLDGKTALVTGAGSVGEGWGNGKAIAVLMARQGAYVFGIDRDEKALAETTARMETEGLTEFWTAVTCDMTDSDAVRASVDLCHTRSGRIDILVNNVGGS